MNRTEDISQQHLLYTSAEKLVSDFCSRGMVILSPATVGVSMDVHTRIFEQEQVLLEAKTPIMPANVPEILDIINAPGVVNACDQLVGRNWAIVPFAHNAPFLSGSNDQHWHKDDNGPYNARKHRHHQAVQIEMLYYPQQVRMDMGPTATIPYSHYWTFNHEENHDNFAGADHLDFSYQLEGLEGIPVSGPNSQYSPEDIVEAKTQHDIRMHKAVADTGWPLVQSFEVGPLDAGSVVLYSHNLFHRGNHRRDDWTTWKTNPRFMWRFWLYRTTEPSFEGLKKSNPSLPAKRAWRKPGIDALTKQDLSKVEEDISAVWRYHYNWLVNEPLNPPTEVTAETNLEDLARTMADQLYRRGDEAEPARIGAAYRLAAIDDYKPALKYLKAALFDERESVRRAATYGLVALGTGATPVFLEATHSSVKWVRKAGVFGLGEVAPLGRDVLEPLISVLFHDPSVYVRSVAAGSLGCLGRRAIASQIGLELVPECALALLDCLAQEQNRPSMDRVQKRSIKLVRPTDDSDICEGIGVTYGEDHFEAVRSAVRENALWSMVILCSHGSQCLGDTLTDVAAMLEEIVLTDKNVINVGYAMDGLSRLAYLHSEEAATSPAVDNLQKRIPALLAAAPMRCWESMCRCGLGSSLVSQFEQSHERLNN